MDADPVMATRGAALVAAGSAVAVLFAVALEVLAGSAANSGVPDDAQLSVASDLIGAERHTQPRDSSRYRRECRTPELLAELAGARRATVLRQ